MSNDAPAVRRHLTEFTCKFIRTPAGLVAQRGQIPTAQTYPIPRIPQSLIDFLIGVGMHFYNESTRCLSAILHLDLENGHWSFAIPPQRCHATHATWSLKAEDLSEISDGYFIAGSVQVVAGVEEEPPLEESFNFDGVHIVIRLDDGRFSVGLIVIAGGERCDLSRIQIVHNQLENLIEAALPDLTAPFDPSAPKQ
ncbi:MAG TPA: hypothetical protein VHD85_08160 [Terracidiphilus sp.]|nr:hypothetical protein [Terracidiphilus sp.]